MRLGDEVFESTAEIEIKDVQSLVVDLGFK